MDRGTLETTERNDSAAEPTNYDAGETPHAHIPVERASTHNRPTPKPIDEIAQAMEHAFLIAKFQHFGETTPIHIDEPLKDYAGKALPCNFKLETDNPHEAAKLALELNLGIVFIGALTSATDNFGSKKQPEGLRGVIAIKPKGLTTNTELKSTPPDQYIENKSDQIIINRNKLGADMHAVTIGAGLTYAQVNEIIARELGPEFWVAVDITSIEEALAGAVFATGGQGPSGIKISQIATRINMTDGEKIHTITDPHEIEEYEGLGGNQGGHTELELKVLKRPPHRFGLRVILKNTKGHQDYSKRAATLLTKIAPYFDLKLDNGILSSAAGADSVDGAEIMDRASIELVYQTRQDPLSKTILDEMDRNKSDYCVYVTGNSTKTFKELCNDEQKNIFNDLSELAELKIDDSKKPNVFDVVSIADETTSTKDIAENLEDMRILREAIPELAKRQVTHSPEKPFSTSLDVNFSIDDSNLVPSAAEEIRQKVLHAFYDYEQNVMGFVGTIAKVKDCNIKMFRYGHLARDPHTRFTVWPNKETDTPGEIRRPYDARDVGASISVFKKRLLATLQEIQKIHPELQIHAGEKGKTLDPEVLSAEILARSQAIIKEAKRNWNFRASRAFLRSSEPKGEPA